MYIYLIKCPERHHQTRHHQIGQCQRCHQIVGNASQIPVHTYRCDHKYIANDRHQYHQTKQDRCQRHHNVMRQILIVAGAQRTIIGAIAARCVRPCVVCDRRIVEKVERASCCVGKL